MATINGTPGNDNLSGTAGADTINGFDGNDFIESDAGDDIIDGGNGFDTVHFHYFNPGVSGTLSVNLTTGTASGTGFGNDTLLNIETIRAEGFDSATLVGDNNTNAFWVVGGSGNAISAGGGDDYVSDNSTGGATLDGGSGNDQLDLERGVGNSSVTATFTPGGSGALADGTSYSNFEYFYVITGGGDDSITFNQPIGLPANSPFLGNQWFAGDGNDTATVDLSSYSTSLRLDQSADGNGFIGAGSVPSYVQIMALLGVENYHVIGGSGNDTFTGGAGSDVFTGNGGNDTLDGGGGADIARYSGLASNYSVTQLSATSFRVTDLRSGSPDGTDTLTNIERLQWGDNSFTKLTNSPPTVITNNKFGGRNQSYTIASLVSVSDADGDTITRYQLYDGNSDPNSGHFLLNGQALPERTVIDLTPSQFAQVSFVSGKVNDDLQIRAFDGTSWSAADNAAWAPFTVSVPANHAPQVTTSNQRFSVVQSRNALTLLSVSDADNDPITRYQLYDNTSDPASGHFMLNGQALPSRVVIDLTAAQMAQAVFVTGSVNDDLQIRASDGIDWSAADPAAWAPFTVGPSANNPPTISVFTSANATVGTTFSLPANITVSDADGDAITRYQLYDDNDDPNSGHFVINGQAQPARIVIDITPAQFAQASFVAGTHSDTLEVRAFDGFAWSAPDNAPWHPFTVQLPANNPPVLTTHLSRTAAGQTVPLSSLVSISDADGDAMVRYQLYDGSSDPNSGHFVVNGQVQSSRVVLDLTAAQAAQTSFVTGTANDDLQVRVFDGLDWSAAYNANWAPFTIGPTADNAPVVTTGSLAAGRNKTIALSSLISVSDADGDAMTRYQLYVNSGASPHGGFFIVNNFAMPWSQVIDITAAQLAQTNFITGSDSVELQIRAFDGISWSAADSAAWSPFTITVQPNTPPVLTTQNMHAAAGQTIALSSLISVSDADGDSIVRYQLYDNSSDPNSGHFTVNGQVQPARQVIDLTAAQAAQTSFVAGTVNDDLQIRANDYLDWSAADSANWAPFTIGPVNQPPMLTTANKRVTAGQSVTLASLLSISDVDGDVMTRYQLYDNSSDPNSGHFTVNGQVQASHVVIDLSAAQAAQTSFVTGTVNDDLQVRVFDGQAWSAADSANWAPFTIGPTANSAPVVTTSNVNTTPGQSLALSSLLSVSDADGDPMTRYQLYDNSSSLNSGHFVISGVAQASRQVIDISAAQFSQTSFLTGSVGDALQIRAFDGKAWSAADSAVWAPFQVNVS